MSAEELLTGDTLFSEDEMTMEMNLDIATDTNKKSLLELREMNKQAAQLKKITVDGMGSILNTLSLIDLNSKQLMWNNFDQSKTDLTKVSLIDQ